MQYVMQDFALVLPDISEILTPVADLNVVLMVNAPQHGHVKKANASILAQVHVERMLYVQSITIYRRVRVLLPPQAILSTCALKLSKVKQNMNNFRLLLTSLYLYRRVLMMYKMF